MPNACTLNLKVIPNASRDEIVGWLGDQLKVKLQAPPVDGRANAALGDFLAEALHVPRRSITVLRGETSRQKVIQIEGLSASEIRARLDR